MRCLGHFLSSTFEAITALDHRALPMQEEAIALKMQPLWWSEEKKAIICFFKKKLYYKNGSQGNKVYPIRLKIHLTFIKDKSSCPKII